MFFGKPRGSLRNKIVIWSFVPTVIILAAVALVSLYTYQRVTEKLVIERDRELTRLSARVLGAELKSYTDPRSDQFLSVFDSGMVLVDERGKILAAESDQLAGWGTDWAKRISLRQMSLSSEPVFSDVLGDGPKEEKIVVAFVPITGRDGASVGGVAGVFRLQPTVETPFYESIERLRRGESNCVYLVDGNGQVIYHSNPELIGQDFSAQWAVQRLLTGEVGALRTHDFEGREIVASFAPVAGTSWGLVTEESWAALTSDSRRYGQLLLVLLAVGVAVPALIVSTGLKRITRPIADLTSAAQKVAGGDFDQKISASSGDELEELAGQFNLMATQLSELYEHLEQKVASRTEELATLNRLAAVVSRSLDLEEVLGDALDEALAIMGLEKGQAFVLEEETGVLALVAHRNVSDELVRYTARLPLGASTSGLAAQEGRPVLRKVCDYPEGELKDLVQEEDLQLVISTPLLAKGKTVGAIDLGAPDLRAIQPEELSMLVAIGNQIGVAVQNARLYEQARQLAVVQERNRLARDLHDSVMQALYGVTMYAEAAARQLGLQDVDVAAEHLHEIRDTAQEALREMRLLIFELRPPALRQDGLVTALRSRLEAVEGRVGLETELDVGGECWLAPDLEEGLYRVAQEALNNTLKHACASHVSVSLRQDERAVILEIVDDGIGFDPAAIHEGGGFGLRSMEERVARLGGKLDVQSEQGKGTRVHVEVGT